MARHGLTRKMIPVFFVLSLMAMGGCVIQSGGWGQARQERMASQQAPRGTSTSLDVDTDNGSIKITGAEVNEFAVTAEIVARAPTDEEAQELAEQTEIRCEQIDNTLRIRAAQPEMRSRNNRSVSVSYTITAPRQMNIRCRSRYGSVDVANVEGTTDVKTNNGSVKVENVRGAVSLNTSYGSITCTDVAGPTVALRSNNGSIAAAHLDGAVTITTSYGAITCDGLSGRDLLLKSNNGKITLTTATFGKCEIDTSYGAVACSDLKGDSARLHSNNGSIELVSAQVNAVNLSSSYGAIRTGEITTADLTAHSGNGSVEVVCSPSCPPDLKADVRSSYGSIRFATPAQFTGQVKLSTSYGTVRTARPITMAGEIDKKNIDGKIGEGAGSIHLETTNGSVELQ